MTKPLEIHLSEDGEPSEQILTENLNMGVYDVALGTEFEFFIRNPNHNLFCDISELNTVNLNSSFHAPDEILPLETVRCTIKIKAGDDLNLDNFDLLKEDNINTHDELKGEIVWKDINVIREDRQKTYGWGN